MVVVSLLLVIPSGSRAATISFDDLSDLVPVTDQFAQSGVSFSNAIALSAGFSLNEFEFPPRSGGGVVADDGGALGIEFVIPVTSLAGHFTYTSRLTLSAFDINDTLLATSLSAFDSNLALSGVPGAIPNEPLAFIGFGDIKRVTVEGSLQGGSFAMDDLSFTPAIPEPASWLLLLTGLMFATRRKRAPQA